MAGNPNPKVAAKYEGTAVMRGVGRSRRAVFTGRVNVAEEDTITQPMRWTRPRRVFVNAMSDLFHPAIERHVLDRLFAVMALSPRHTFQVLTKRPELAALYLQNTSQEARDRRGTEVVKLGGITDGLPWPLPNVWMGTSVEDQETANDRIPELVQAPAALRFLSMEPLLGPVLLPHNILQAGLLDWIIIGGESGPNSRPFNLAWARSLVMQCRDAGVPVFVKQLGARPEVVEGGWNNPSAPEGVLPVAASGLLDDRKGGDMGEWPVDLRVREMPEVECQLCEGSGKVGRNHLEGPDPCPDCGGAGTWAR